MDEPLKSLMAMGVAVMLVAGSWALAVASDEIILRSGEHLRGDIEQTELVLQTPDRAYRVTRATAWRLELSGASGDAVHFRNGDRLSGLLDQAGYTIHLTEGRTKTLSRSEIDTVTLGAVDRAQSSPLRDLLILVNGDHIYGELRETEFDLVLATGTHRFERTALWRLVLDTAAGDSAELAEGSHVSGLVDHARYSIRTADGQLLRFRRDEVAEVRFRLPERAVAAPSSASAAAAPPGGGAPGAQVAAVPAPSLPPPLQKALRDIYFEFDAWGLTFPARQVLEELAAAMKEFPRSALRIEGHADERGTPEYNLALGERRAQAARDYLVNLGIAPARIDVVSYGEERPLDPTHGEIAWALNRRAHFEVTTR